MRLIENYEHRIHEGLHGWAGEHAQSYPELFELLPIDTGQFPHQHVLTRHIAGNTLPAVMVDEIAANIDPRYPDISQSIDSDTANILRIGELMASGKNVILGTGHDELIDIAIILTKVRTALENMGYEFEIGIIVNSIVKYLGVKLDEQVLPALDVLGYAADHIYVNIPSTQSGRQKIPIPKRVVSAHNSAVTNLHIAKRLKATGKKREREGGKKEILLPMLLGIALSGTVSKPLDVEAYQKMIKEDKDVVWIPQELRERARVIGRVSHKLTTITSLGMTVPTASNLTPGAVSVRFFDAPLYVNSPDKLDETMQRIADLEQLDDSEHFHVYDKLGNLPVKRLIKI